jgi:hypothetical protein
MTVGTGWELSAAAPLALPAILNGVVRIPSETGPIRPVSEKTYQAESELWHRDYL